MRIEEILRAEKTDIEIGEWGTGKMPKGQMPLSKAGHRAHVLGSSWRWRFLKFSALGYDFVVRLIVCEGKRKAHAHLARRIGADCAVLASYEFHPDLNTGWHLHAFCDEIEDAPKGTLVHGPWVKRIPVVRSRHRRGQFVNPDALGDVEAFLWRQTMRFFRVEKKGPLV